MLSRHPLCCLQEESTATDTARHQQTLTRAHFLLLMNYTKSISVNGTAGRPRALESLCVPPFNRLDRKDGETGRNTEKVTELAGWLVMHAWSYYKAH